MKKITDYMIMTSIHAMCIVCDNVLCHDEHCTTTTNYVSTNNYIVLTQGIKTAITIH